MLFEIDEENKKEVKIRRFSPPGVGWGVAGKNSYMPKMRLR